MNDSYKRYDFFLILSIVLTSLSCAIWISSTIFIYVDPYHYYRFASEVGAMLLPYNISAFVASGFSLMFSLLSIKLQKISKRHLFSIGAIVFVITNLALSIFLQQNNSTSYIFYYSTIEHERFYRHIHLSFLDINIFLSVADLVTGCLYLAVCEKERKSTQCINLHETQQIENEQVSIESKLDQLKNLKSLLDNGICTQTEYDALKQHVIDKTML